MSDSEDANSRRPQRPSTPPFRGPASPAGKPPLTPPAGGSRAVPSRTPGVPGSRAVPAQPVMPPPASPGGRPATPSQGARRPAATPARPAATPSRTPPSAPAYGTAPPASVAATLQSIGEFTIVEAPDQGTAADATAPDEPPRERLAYDAPSMRERRGEDASGNPEFEDRPADGTDGFDESADTQVALAGGTEPWPSNDADSEAAVEEGGGPEGAFESVAITSADPEAGDAAHFSSGSWSADEAEGAPFEERSDASPHRPGDVAESGFASAARDVDTSAGLAAASLEEIARQLRSGEVRVGAIDSMAEAPAILAAVLAAMLAHRR